MKEWIKSHKALPDALGELLIPYLHDISHVEYLNTEKPDEGNRHHHGQNPYCRFFHWREFSLTYVLLTINLSEMLTRAGENTLCVNETAALTFAPKINKHM